MQFPVRFMTAPTNAPPLLPPWQTSFSLQVHPSLMRYLPHSSKSENATGLFSLIAALCHSSPNSPPPRMLATQYSPPVCSNIVAVEEENEGLSEILKPPYLELVQNGGSSTHREDRKHCQTSRVTLVVQYTLESLLHH